MNKKLSQLYQEDIADRNSGVPSDQLNSNDQKRIAQVQQIIDRDPKLQAEDYHQVALIFQHGETIGHYKKAHELAIQAVEMGDGSARWLAAVSLDRSLLMEGKPQNYGTQFKLNSENEWELVLPVDPSVTDEERATWHVPPLKDALKVYKQKYNL